MGLILTWLVAGLLVAAPAHATAFLGPLAGLVLLGEEAPWHGTVEGDAYVLTNREDSESVEYVYVRTPGSGLRALSTQVRLLDADEGAGAGLLYGYRPDPRSYVAVALQEDGVVRVLRHGPDGLLPMLAAGKPEGEAGIVELALVERDRGVEVLIDGVHAVLLEHEGQGEGAVGIVAFGIGRFAFESFALDIEEPTLDPVAESAVGRLASVLEQLQGAPPQPGAGGPSPLPHMGLTGPMTGPGQPQPGFPMQPPMGPGPQPGVPGMQPPAGPTPGFPMVPQPPVGQPPVVQPHVPQPPPLDMPTVREDGTGRGGYEAIVGFARQLGERLGQGGGAASAGVPEGWVRHVDRQSGGRLSVDHPRGWQASSVARMEGPGALSYGQARVASPDGQLFFEAGMATVQRVQDTYSHIDGLVRELASWLPIQAQVDEQTWYPPLPAALAQAGVPAQTEWLARAYVAGDHLAVLVVGSLQIHIYGGGGVSMFSHRLFVGPIAGFTTATREVFLPMFSSTAHW